MKQINVYMTNADLVALDATAYARGMPLSQWARYELSAIKGATPEVPPGHGLHGRRRNTPKMKINAHRLAIYVSGKLHVLISAAAVEREISTSTWVRLYLSTQAALAPRMPGPEIKALGLSRGRR